MKAIAIRLKLAFTQVLEGLPGEHRAARGLAAGVLLRRARERGPRDVAGGARSPPHGARGVVHRVLLISMSRVSIGVQVFQSVLVRQGCFGSVLRVLVIVRGVLGVVLTRRLFSCHGGRTPVSLHRRRAFESSYRMGWRSWTNSVGARE